jgi:hypothetical protein
MEAPKKDPKKTYTQISTKNKAIAHHLNTVADYRRTNQFINDHAPVAASKHMDLVLKNRKDNQQRK